MRKKLTAVHGAALVVVFTFTVLLTACLTEVVETVKVTFDVAGGSPQPDPVVLSRGKTLGDKFPATPPTKGTDDFLGWFDSFDQFTAETVINADVTLTAKWKSAADSDTATVTFQSPDAIPATTTVTVTKGKALGPLFPVDPRKQGAWFNEWQTGGTAFTKDTVVTSNITVTADWTDKTKEYTVTLKVPAAHQAANPGINDKTFTVWEGDCMNDWKGADGKLPFPTTLNCADSPDVNRAYRFMRWAVDEGTPNFNLANGIIYTERTPITADVTLTGYYVFNFIPKTFEIDLTTALSKGNQKNTSVVSDAQAVRTPVAELVGTPQANLVVAKFNEQPQFLYFNVPVELIDLMATASVAAETQFMWEIDATLTNTATKAVIANSNPDYAVNILMHNLANNDNWNATDVRELTFDQINGLTGEPSAEADRIHNVAGTITNSAANRYWIGIRTRSNGWKGTDPGQGPATMTIKSFKIHLVQ